MSKNSLLGHDLLLCGLVYVTSVINYYNFSIQFIQALSGVLLYCFVPGYLLLCLVFLSKKDISFSLRILLSFPLSIAIVGITGFLFGSQFLPWKMSSESFFISLGIFILFFSLSIYSLRLWYKIDFFNCQDVINLFREIPFFQRITIGITSLVVITMIIFILSPSSNTLSSQIHVVGLDGKVDSLPSEFTDNNPIEFLLGVSNNTAKNQDFIVEIILGDTVIQSIESPILKSEHEWIHKVILDKPVDNYPEMIRWQKLEFLLKEEIQNDAISSIYFWVRI